jgi:CheY-like chemotaxis protein
VRKCPRPNQKTLQNHDRGRRGDHAADLAGKLRLSDTLCGQASSRDEACVWLQRAPDLILMDIALQGGMDGIGTPRSIRVAVEYSCGFPDRVL